MENNKENIRMSTEVADAVHHIQSSDTYLNDTINDTRRLIIDFSDVFGENQLPKVMEILKGLNIIEDDIVKIQGGEI